MKRFIFYFLFLNLVSLSSFAGIEGGGCGGHGGDGYSLEFYRLGKKLVQDIKTWSKEDLSRLSVKFRPEELDSAVEKTRIVSTLEPLKLLKKEVDAINHSENSTLLIEVNRPRWDSYEGKRAKKMGIVLHEYLGIVQGLYGHGEWDNYQLSDEILAIYEQKYIHNNRLPFERKRKEIKAAFLAASTPFSGLQKGMAWSCAEFSALKDDESIFYHENAYLFSKKDETLNNYGTWQSNITFTAEENLFVRQWIDQDPTESIDNPDSNIKEFMKLTASGDLVVEVTTDYRYSNQVTSMADPKRGALSYFYCSKLGSQTLKMMNFMSSSLLPIFDTPTTPAYEDYKKKLEDLADSRRFKRCEQKPQGNACRNTYKALTKIKLSPETESLNTAKTNLEKINVWLNSLNDQENGYASKAILELFNQYVVHQEYLSSILDVGETPYMDNMKFFQNFLDGLKTRLPLAYAEAKVIFQRETVDAKRKTILEFAPSF
ncbi:MAG: hypothetical protein ACOYL6_15380 [Bacteriovoracaceae bacterium]